MDDAQQPTALVKRRSIRALLVWGGIAYLLGCLRIIDYFCQERIPHYANTVEAWLGHPVSPDGHAFLTGIVFIVSFALLAFSRRWLLLAALFILPPLIVIIVGPMIALPREYVTSTPCASHQRQLAVAIIMYAQDHGDRLPSNFADLTEYRDAPRIFDCPPGHGAFTRGGYGYNANLIGRKLGAFAEPTEIVVTADSIEPGMLLRSAGDIAWKRHGSGYWVSYLYQLRLMRPFSLPWQLLQALENPVPAYKPFDAFPIGG